MSQNKNLTNVSDSIVISNHYSSEDVHVLHVALEEYLIKADEWIQKHYSDSSPVARENLKSFYLKLVNSISDDRFEDISSICSILKVASKNEAFIEDIALNANFADHILCSLNGWEFLEHYAIESLYSEIISAQFQGAPFNIQEFQDKIGAELKALACMISKKGEVKNKSEMIQKSITNHYNLFLNNSSVSRCYHKDETRVLKRFSSILKDFKKEKQI